MKKRLAKLTNSLWFHIFVSILVFGFFFYVYLDHQNALIRLRLKVPSVIQEIKEEVSHRGL